MRLVTLLVSGAVRPGCAAGVASPAGGGEPGSGIWWLHSLDWFHLSESYHPTSDGYRLGYLPVLTGVTG